MEKNVDPDATDDNILWRMRTACWITRATGTQTCHTYCLCTATVVARTGIYVTFIRTLLVLLKSEIISTSTIYFHNLFMNLVPSEI